MVAGASPGGRTYRYSLLKISKGLFYCLKLLIEAISAYLNMFDLY